MSEAPILKTVYRLDSIPVDETYYTKEGFLIDHPVVTTVGIFEYMNPDGSVRRELIAGGSVCRGEFGIL